MAHFEEFYTADGIHPEDEIYKVKSFIKELMSVQEEYIKKTANRLRLTTEGEELLFDYIYNVDFNEYDGFDHYLDSIGKDYRTFVCNG